MRTRTGIAALGAALLGGCGSISSAIAPPEMSPISNPATIAGSDRDRAERACVAGGQPARGADPLAAGLAAGLDPRRSGPPG